MTTALGKISVAAAFVLAGSSVVAARYIADFLPPFTVTFLSLVFAVATIVPFHGGKTLAAVRRLRFRRWRILFLQAFLGIALFRVFLTFGLQSVSAAEASIITGAAPAITVLFAMMILRESLSAAKAIGVVLALAGIMILQAEEFSTAEFTPEHVTGYALVLAATACEALFAVLSRKIHFAVPDREEDLHPVSHAGIVSGIALILCLFPMLAESPYTEVLTLPPSGWLALIWYGAVVTIVAFTCMFSGAKVCDGYTISAFTGIIPLSALVLSIIILGDGVSAYQWLGCLVIGISLWLISRQATILLKA